MMENGDTRDDLTLPHGTDEYDRLAKQLKEDFADGKEIIVTVLKVRESLRHSPLDLLGDHRTSQYFAAHALPTSYECPPGHLISSGS